MLLKAERPVPAVAIVVHDVSPVTWPQCERLFRFIASVGANIPLTLLVVPQFHGSARIDEDLGFRRLIDMRVAAGDELALHGLTHLDDGPAPSTPTEWIARRVLTDGEAEFAALSFGEAQARIEKGLEMFARCGWRPAGFVPPAWQLNAAALSAVTSGSYPFRYVSTLGSIISLPEGERLAVPALGFSARSALRRQLSITWNNQRLALLDDTPLIRIALHPADAEHGNTMLGWRRLIHATLLDRKPVTKSVLVQSSICRARHQRPMTPRREPAS